jgi:hypothetical protein
MRKFILGFFLGAILVAPVAVFASNQINAILFPCKVINKKDCTRKERAVSYAL